jgi:type IV secretory pathway VirB2 component (pilin)
MNSRRLKKQCLSHRHLAAHVDHSEVDQFATSVPYTSDFDYKPACRSAERTYESSRTTYRLPFGFGVATALLLPAPCWAAAGELPWDQTLLALQNILVGPLAQAAIALAFVGAGILYALGGHDKQAGRLAASGIGGCLALSVIRLLNFVFP